MASIIPFLPKQRLLARASAAADADLADAKAVNLCLRALPLAQSVLKQRLLLFLARNAPDRTAGPALDMVTDPKEPFGLRLCAAIQLRGMLCKGLSRQEEFLARLLAGLSDERSEMRRLALSALGFPGNRRAFSAFCGALLDPDEKVRLAAIASTAGLCLPEAFAPLLDVLNKGSYAEKRAVIFNLWRTGHDPEALSAVYGRYVFHENPEIRLACMAFLPDRRDLLASLLRDPDRRVRIQALERLCALGPAALAPAAETLHNMLEDPDMQIKKAALAAIKMMEKA